ncbi:MAG: shikimate dehydrogenase [Mesorhizobium sp.]|jgi:shikimate dehydrogenase
MGDSGRKAFICGHPISHSRSPIIHNYWLKQLGIAGNYTAIDVAPETFPQFISGLNEAGLVGGNVTIPHKEAACALVEKRDAAAELIGAVNTLWLEEGVVHGGNTDAHGFAANLDDSVPGWSSSERAVVLGAGGASRAVVFALQQRGIKSIRLVNRTLERAQELARRFGARVSAHELVALPELITEADLLINTTSLGMHGSGTPADVTRLPNTAIVADIVYVPLQTPLLAAAAARNLRTVDGLGMLLHQAVPGFERWFGKRPQVTSVLREILVADVEKRG